jgi:hypothetical protein
MFKFKLYISFLILVCAIPSWAQTSGRVDFRTTEETKSDYFTWIENYDEALEESKRTGKPIFLIFRCVP